MIGARKKSRKIKKQGMALSTIGFFVCLAGYFFDFLWFFPVGLLGFLYGFYWYKRSKTWSIGARGEEKVI
ncbi:MAG: hypothetical protein BTN85_1246 [Candidatus Methanohalarchaeum thermophilum]|uniref:Uncharacterized protein n=1 Tax=Methanohalarchaeum thermophilum TaxID=1903181 RepID=A0A1Q6DWL9_METT1|nr:MAG: hypothetical protein BTN85_1246 [Candidatus Methanohalarchaeum thermophilum]